MSRQPLAAHEVEISDGLTLADLTSVEACQLALLTIARDINHIDEQLADGPGAGGWAERAESAVRFKKTLREVVKQKMADLRRQAATADARSREHVLIEQIKADWPGQFGDSLRRARSAHPNLWKDTP